MAIINASTPGEGLALPSVAFEVMGAHVDNLVATGSASEFVLNVL